MWTTKCLGGKWNFQSYQRLQDYGVCVILQLRQKNKKEKVVVSIRDLFRSFFTSGPFSFFHTRSLHFFFFLLECIVFNFGIFIRTRREINKNR